MATEYGVSAVTGTENLDYGNDLIDKVYKCRREASVHQADWREEAREAFEYRDGHQWTAEDRARLEEQNRPTVTFNRVGPVISSITGYEINNRMELKFIPRTEPDAEPNEIFTAAAKWIMDGCDGADEESHAYEDAITCGMGWTEWRIDYLEDPDGKILKERVSPLQMRWDTRARKRNLSDARWLLREKRMSLDEIEERWPGKAIVGSTPVLAEDEEYGEPHDASRAWQYGESQTVNESQETDPIVIHYQWREMETYYRVADPQTGQIASFSQKKFNKLKDFIETMGTPYVKQKRWKYKQAYITGQTVLEELDTPIPAFTYSCITARRQESDNTFYGLMRAMKDPQMWANKFFSMAMEIFSSNSKGGVIFEDGAIEDIRDFEDKWSDPNGMVEVAAGALTGGRIREREKGGYPASLDKLMTFAISSIRDCTGINLEMLGLADRDQPGILEMERKKAALVILSPLINSLHAYRVTDGYKLLDLIRTYIPEGTIMRVTDKAYQYANHDDTVKYDVIIDTAPTSPNLKTEVWSVLGQMVPSLVKAGVPIPPQLIKFSPLPESVAQEWIGYIEDQSKKVEPDVHEQVVQELQQAQEEIKKLKDRTMIDLARLAVDREENHLDARNNMANAQSKARDIEIDAVKGDLDRLERIYSTLMKTGADRERNVVAAISAGRRASESGGASRTAS